MSQLDRLQERIGDLEAQLGASDERCDRAKALWERMVGRYPAAGVVSSVLAELLGTECPGCPQVTDDTPQAVTDTLMVNLKSALVAAGHDADCPVVHGASVDCVNGCGFRHQVLKRDFLQALQIITGSLERRRGEDNAAAEALAGVGDLLREQLDKLHRGQA